MSAITAPQRPVVTPGAERNFACDFSGELDEGESLAGTPTVVEQTTDDLLIEDVAVSAGTLRINGRSVAAGNAVQFSASGFSAARTSYRLKIIVGTDAGQTLVAYLVVAVATQ
jgi:hypothetical protein